MILHTSIMVAQNLSRRNSHAQINRERLTYGHRNPLNHLNYRETRELASNEHEQYSGSPEHQHCLGSAIIFKGCIKENQQRTVLYRNPDLDYERVVTQSYEVNQLSLSESDNKPSLRGEALISAVPHSANEISPVQEKRKGGISNPTLWLVVYRQTTENPAVHSITESNPAQPFGSMPCRRNSARASSFNQLPRLTPSRSAASLSCCRNSGVIRIWKVGDSPSPFGVLSRLIVDMYVRNLIAWILLCTYVITTNMQKTTPRTAGTVPGRLTSTDKLRIEEAMKDHITHPQGRKSYIWRFLALSAIGRNVIHITATTEREAREQSPDGCVMVFAGRLPVREGHHA